MRKIFRPSLRKLGVLLIVLGFGVIMYVPATWLQGYWERRHLAADFSKESATTMVVDQSILGKLQGAADIEKLRQLSSTFDHGLYDEQPIAHVQIPKIGLDVIAVEGTTSSDLSKGAGHLEGTPIPGMQGNFVLTGDRVLYGAPFLNLDEVGPGDQIQVTTPYGRFTYTVTGKPLIYQKDDKAIDGVLASQGKESITLVTCDPVWGTSHRLFVQAQATSAKPIQ